MAWVKISPEHHPLFRAALPADKRITTLTMFGGVAAKTNGKMFAGLFARSAMVKLGGDDLAGALALDGAVPFDPMGNGRVMHDAVLLPDDVMEDPAELRAWLRKAFEHVAATKPAAKPKPIPGVKPKPKIAAKRPRTRR
jgi:TfoX/Sxy family transcriptional regulator of competence genes